MDTMLERKRQEGRQEGIQEAKKEIYENLLKLGVDPEILKKAYPTYSN